MITVQIGNSDNRLSQSDWSAYIAKVDKVLKIYSSYNIHFSGGSPSEAAWQNYCWCVDIKGDDLEEGLKADLKMIARQYDQTAIAWCKGEVEMI